MVARIAAMNPYQQPPVGPGPAPYPSFPPPPPKSGNRLGLILAVAIGVPVVLCVLGGFFLFATLGVSSTTTTAQAKSILYNVHDAEARLTNPNINPAYEVVEVEDAAFMMLYTYEYDDPNADFYVYSSVGLCQRKSMLKSWAKESLEMTRETMTQENVVVRHHGEFVSSKGGEFDIYELVYEGEAYGFYVVGASGNLGIEICATSFLHDGPSGYKQALDPIISRIENHNWYD